DYFCCSYADTYTFVF
nr:immunoglobulin light chain junction region [Macaca mulatta]MOV72198.1 immunoglobulin light chain junction region [Macaca mulatta]MOV72208.1 immunoglobulin light chain junction region [Macaca mulatta]MOV72291.1 immunoglobulin light chain junction region [Macaca mulatta]MOV72337.1 immunoglobulin light chain junction region [Macaca mulatta]